MSNVEKNISNDNNPIIIAAKTYDLEMARSLLKKGIYKKRILTYDYGWTSCYKYTEYRALEIAVSNKDIGMIKLLLEAGVKPHQYTEYDECESVIQHVFREYNFEIIKILFQAENELINGLLKRLMDNITEVQLYEIIRLVFQILKNNRSLANEEGLINKLYRKFLSRACKYENIDIITFLLEYNSNLIDNTDIILYYRGRNTKLIRLLLTHKIKIISSCKSRQDDIFKCYKDGTTHIHM
jgi:ankyrin repeat protein